MKTLLILRHAKSSWSDLTQDDFDRPLNERGRRDAPRMGKLLRAQSLVPEVILASSAVRTLETAKLLGEAAGFAGEIIARSDLYLAPAAQYVALMNDLHAEYNSVLLLGHNPGMQHLVSTLADSDLKMPTAALACFALPTKSWSDLRLAPTGTLQGYWKPKELEEIA